MSVRSTDVIVPVWNLPDYTKNFIDSVEPQRNCNLIVIDNGSEKETRDYLASVVASSALQATVIRNEENLGYVKAVNQGLRESTADSILLANNDTLMPPDLVAKLQDGLEEVDLIGPLSNNVGTEPHPLLVEYELDSMEGLNRFSQALEEANKGQIEPIDYLYGHCLMLKRQVYEEVGSLDERFGIGNHDDIDYCRRAKEAGFKIGLRRDAFIYHFCHTTFKALDIDLAELMKTNEEVYNEKWQ